MSRFEIGAEVCWLPADDLKVYNTDEDATEKGQVAGFNQITGHVIVEWESDWMRRRHPQIAESELHTAEELKAKVAQLEKEYDDLAKVIGDKVKEAAEKLNEASAIADQHGRDLSSLHDIVRPMMGAMRNAGWRTSALHC